MFQGNMQSGVSRVITQTTVVTRNIDGASWQVAPNRDALVVYAVQISASLTLIGGQQGALFLETSPTGSVWTLQSQMMNGNTGTLTIGLNTLQTAGGNLTAYVPAGYLVRIRSSSVTGTPTFTWVTGQETLL